MLRHSLSLVYAALLWTLVADVSQSQTPVKDVHGDPLPADAVARLGTVRLRHDSAIVFAAFLPGGKSILSVGRDGIVCEWEFPSGKELRRFEVLPAAERGTGVTVRVTSASLSPDHKRLTALCGDGFMRIWDWANAKQVGKVAIASGSARGRGPGGGGGGFGDIFDDYYGYDDSFGVVKAYSADSKTVMLYGSRVLQLVDLASGKEMGPSIGHASPLISIWITPDGKEVLTKDARTTRRWDRATGKDLGSLDVKLPSDLEPANAKESALTRLLGNSTMVVSPDGRVGLYTANFLTAAAARDAKSRDAVLFDTATGKELAKIELEIDGTSAYHRKPILFSPDGKLLAVNTGIEKEKIEVYDVPGGKRLRTLDAGAPQAAAGPLGGFRGSAAGKLLFSPDGRTLAFQGAAGAEIVLFHTASGEKIGALTPSTNSVPAMQGAFTPDGRNLALQMRKGTVELYEVASGQPRRTYDSKPSKVKSGKGSNDDMIADLLGVSAASNRPNPSFAFSPDGKLLALPGPDAAVVLVDVLSGKELAIFKGHRGAVNALAFAPDNKTLASAATDSTALIWDITKVKLPAVKTLDAEGLRNCWQELGQRDAGKAFAALGDLLVAPKQTVDLLTKEVKPAAPLDLKRIGALVSQLDDDQQKVRDNASDELLKMGDHLAPVLDKFHSSATPEAKRRLESLRGKMTGLPMQGERLRAYRVVELLDHIGTPEARKLLQTLANGVAGATLTISAQAALKR